MASLKERAAATLARLREKFPWLDHILRMVQHYGAVNGNAQAGAVTYFGFLSFFPILALGFFVIGLVAQLYPDIKPQMVAELNALLPGVIGNDPGQISLKTIESYSGRVGLIGLLVLLYAGLGWLSGLRQALEVMFVVPRREQTNFLLGKLRDLGTLGADRSDPDGLGDALGRRDRLLRADPGLARHRRHALWCRPSCSRSSGTCWRSRRPPCCCWRCSSSSSPSRTSRAARWCEGRCWARSASRC